MSDDRQCAASNEDLRRGALEHYERLSKMACDWHSAVPRAINFYFDRQAAPADGLPEEPTREQIHGGIYIAARYYDLLRAKAQELQTALAAALEREKAGRKELAQSTNYVADKAVEPTIVWFSNGRVVRAVGGHLEVEMNDALSV